MIRPRRLMLPALFLVMAAALTGCKLPSYSNISAGDLYSYVPGRPNFNFGAFGYYDQNMLPGMRVDISIPYNSLIFKAENEKNTKTFVASFNLELQITRIDSSGTQPLMRNFTRTLTVDDYRATRSLGTYPINFKTILVPGTYDIKSTLVDEQSGKMSSRTLRASIPNPNINLITTGAIELLGKKESDRRSALFRPVLTYHVSNDLDSLKAAIQLFLNSANNNLNLSMSLVRFRTDTMPARPPYYLTPMQGSLEYRGIDFGKPDTVQLTRRSYKGISGAIAIDFLLPSLQRGNYRVTIEGQDPGNKISFSRARDFAVRNKAYPRLTSLDELVEATYYVASGKEYKRLMTFYGTDSLKQAFDTFWANLIPNKNKAQSVIGSYYNRVEEANMLFSTYKEGWKTDPGMIYIVMGPPAYVEQNVEGMTWYYTNYSNENTNAFFFRQVHNTRDYFPFHHFQLVRNMIYEQTYIARVEDWRNGIVP